MFKVAIIGASGYTGGELLRMLLNHPEVEITDITSSSSNSGFNKVSLLPSSIVSIKWRIFSSLDLISKVILTTEDTTP